jgi:hypothetical protein
MLLLILNSNCCRHRRNTGYCSITRLSIIAKLLDKGLIADRTQWITRLH